MSEHILSLSYGKDSPACIYVIKEVLRWPLDRIVHAEVWATDTIPADLPPMVEFKAKADRIIKERWGIEVEHRRAKVTFEEQFYRVRKNKTVSEMKIYGFPIVRGAWCNSKLKMAAMPKLKSGDVSYIGIAADEPNRFHNLAETKRSPLVEEGWTEAMCRKWCEENGLLSPIYTTATRGGCWFCHNQGVDQLRLLRRDYPEYWALLMKWDLDSPVTFKPDGHTVHDFDRRFALEDEGIVNPIHPFRWAMLDGDVQLRF
jgi:3'-phosphoadenosine 5'-phosphosulfate sulfotransferase (PAPS reductase)/FAD synthetase